MLGLSFFAHLSGREIVRLVSNTARTGIGQELKFHRKGITQELTVPTVLRQE